MTVKPVAQQDHYAAYEIQPVVEADDSYIAFITKQQAVEAYGCAALSATSGADCRLLWTIYGRLASNGLAEAIGDFLTPEAAASTLSNILGRSVTPSPDYLVEQVTAIENPVFWYRPCSDGSIEGPILDSLIEEARKASGAWVPLFVGQQPDRVAELDQAVGSGRNMYYAGQHDAEEPADAADRLALVAERDELFAEVERLRKDAERYQQVRRGQKWSVIDGIGATLRGERLDDAIDAAMAVDKEAQS